MMGGVRATRDQCPNCGTTITKPDPAAPSGPGSRGSETAVCPACGKWLWRRPGERWEQTD
jgi:predicted RNA-binding Zn-ribbon protein involved in translation (DUF1610 family)